MQRNYPQFDRSIYDISKIFWLEKSSGGPKEISRYVVISDFQTAMVKIGPIRPISIKNLIYGLFVVRNLSFLSKY